MSLMMSKNMDLSTFNDRMHKISLGIDLLLNQFAAANQKLFPRKMAMGSQYGITVNSKEDIMSECLKAGFVDCRLNSYPVIVDSDIQAGLVSPNMLFADIDKPAKMSMRTFQTIREEVQERIVDAFGVEPTILWTGGGDHYYTVISTRPLKIDKELVSMCAAIGCNVEPSREFLKFAEVYITDEARDPNHTNSLSFNSSLQRIPGTFNSKYIDTYNDPEVKIVQSFKGVGEIPFWLIVKLKSRLTTMRAKLEQKRRIQQYTDRMISQGRYDYNNSNGNNSNDYRLQKYAWIETLLKTPIANNRYFVIWRIIGPYLRRIKGLGFRETEIIVREWLGKCNEMRKVESFETKVKGGLITANAWDPLSMKTLIEYNNATKGEYDNILKVVCVRVP